MSSVMPQYSKYLPLGEVFLGNQKRSGILDDDLFDHVGGMLTKIATVFKTFVDLFGSDQLLGIGLDGHIGFNEPSDTFSDGTFKVKLTDSTIASNSIYFENDSMPRYALTMGINSIMKAKKVVLIATGDSKAEAIKATINGEVTPMCPASILKNHPDAILLIDKAAAKLL